MKTLLSLIYITSICFLSVGCASIKQPAPKKSFVNQLPDVGKIYTVELGSSVLKKTQGKTRLGVIILENIVWGGGAEIYPEQKAKAAFIDEKYDYFGPLEGPLVGVYLGISKERSKAVLLWNDTTWSLKNYPKIEITDFVDDNSDFFSQEFIYNGKTDNNLKFLYREFTNNRIRGDFSQEVQYDINVSKEIGFKGARINIHEADNRKLKYEVLSHFSQ